MTCHYCHQPITSHDTRWHAVDATTGESIYYHGNCHTLHRHGIPPSVDVPFTWIIIFLAALSLIIWAFGWLNS